MAEFHLAASFQGPGMVHAGSPSHYHSLMGTTVGVISNTFPTINSKFML